ncbi:MAG: hypothetical protein ABIJ59_01420 [Pseudomonadota bacterium]
MLKGQPAPRKTINELTLNKNKITLHADRVKLQTLMNDLSQKADIKIHIDPDLNPYITADFNNTDLQSALESILTPLNHVLEWESTPASSGSRIRLAEIHIFKLNKKDPAIPAEKALNREIARNPEDGSFYVKGELLLRLKPGMDITLLNTLLKQLGGTLIQENSALGIYRIKLPDPADIPNLVKQIKDLPGIEMAEPNYAYPIALPYRYVTDAKTTPRLDFKPPSDDSVPIAVLNSGHLIQMDTRPGPALL